MIKISQLKLLPNHSENDLVNEISKLLGLKPDYVKTHYKIIKKSIDARKKPDIFVIYSVYVDTPFLKSYKRLKNITAEDEITYSFTTSDKSCPPPIVVGLGPAGLFAGLQLARWGLKPIIIERGKCVQDRIKDVEAFFDSNILNPYSNVQFGEGGAGTFSDGKLNTMVKDPYGRIKFVLETFVKYGADPSILYNNKPHIGTDVLQKIVKNMRDDIISLGGTVLFNHKLTDIHIVDNHIKEIVVNDEKIIPCDKLVLAIGHSARDTFELIKNKKLNMAAKAFAVGIRIEHPQALINTNAYGNQTKYNLPTADYKVTHQCKNGRGVYSFCMCPGGYVVNASSEEGHLAVNGMSYSKRDGKNANSALIVTVSPADYGLDDVLCGVRFQRMLEKKAYQTGKSYIPVQQYKDFKNNIESKEFGDLLPATKGDVRFGNLREIFPEYINEALLEGIEAFGKKIPGYDHGSVILSGVESRTSSPVRIIRDDETFMSNIYGIFPCGEGAGYAGGITSAAVDGIKVAEKIYKLL